MNWGWNGMASGSNEWRVEAVNDCGMEINLLISFLLPFLLHVRVSLHLDHRLLSIPVQATSGWVGATTLTERTESPWR